MSAYARITRHTAHLSVAVLALWGLTACGNDEPGEPDETAGATEEPTEDATEPAQDETANAEADADEPAAEADAPAFDDVRDAIWSASQAQESVRITGDMADPNATLNEESAEIDDEDSDEDSDESPEEDTDGESDEAELLSLSVYGDLAGEASAFELGDVYEYRVFGDEVLQSVDSLANEYEAIQPEGTESPDAEEIRSAFSAEGSWANLGPAAQGAVETPGIFLANLEQGFTQAQEQAEDESATEWEVESDVHEGEDVWVYSRGESGNGSFITVLADEQEPLLVHLGYEFPGQPATSIEFLDWNETDGPERPEDDEVISPEEVQSILQELGG